MLGERRRWSGGFRGAREGSAYCLTTRHAITTNAFTHKCKCITIFTIRYTFFLCIFYHLPISLSVFIIYYPILGRNLRQHLPPAFPDVCQEVCVCVRARLLDKEKLLRPHNLRDPAVSPRAHMDMPGPAQLTSDPRNSGLGHRGPPSGSISVCWNPHVQTPLWGLHRTSYPDFHLSQWSNGSFHQQKAA